MSWVEVPVPPASPTVPPGVALSVGVGVGEGCPPMVGQVSEGTQANLTTYEVLGFSTTEATSVEGSGSPVAASPATCVTTLILAESAAPCARVPTVPAPLTVQLVAEMFERVKEP